MKRPPYAKTLIERVTLPYSWWVLIGAGAWDKARIWAEHDQRIFTVCPPGEDPAQFDWSLFRNAPTPVGLVRCGTVDGQQLQALLKAMLEAGSPRIYDLLGDFSYEAKRVMA